MFEGQDQGHNRGSRAGERSRLGVKVGVKFGGGSREGVMVGGLGVGARVAVGFSGGVEMKKNVPDLIPIHFNPFQSMFYPMPLCPVLKFEISVQKGF